jgi:hypothetical protein
MTPAEIAKGLTKAQRRNMLRTPVPQPLENVWLWPGSVNQAWELAKLRLLNKSGFTPLGLAVRAELERMGRA